MKVICIKTEFYINDDRVSVIYGNVYSVTNVCDSKELLIDADISDGMIPAKGSWYKLEGLKGYHHESNFMELPEELFKTNELIKNENI
jgi:hypothetical protein